MCCRWEDADGWCSGGICTFIFEAMMHHDMPTMHEFASHYCSEACHVWKWCNGVYMWVAERGMGIFYYTLFGSSMHICTRWGEQWKPAGDKSSRMKSITQCSTQAGSPHQLPASAPARDQTCFRLRRGAPATPSTLGASVRASPFAHGLCTSS